MIKSDKLHRFRVRVRLWVEALRSGEFHQGRHFLKNADGTMCCLGVACVVAMRNGCDIEEYPVGLEGPTYFGKGIHRSVSYPPYPVLDWYGFRDRIGFDLNPNLAEEGDDTSAKFISAVVANDDLGWTFDQIADAIETQYLANETLEEYFANYDPITGD
jgi:hypothetical protein